MEHAERTQRKSPILSLVIIVTVLLALGIIGAGVYLGVRDTLKPPTRYAGTIDLSYEVGYTVRRANSEDHNWSTSIQVSPGDVLDVQIQYDNTSSETQHNVAVYSQLPEGLTYVPDSTRLYNATYPDGVQLANNDLCINGILIDHYGGRQGTSRVGGNAYLRFQVQVDNLTEDTTLESVLKIAPEEQTAEPHSCTITIEVITPNYANLNGDNP